MASVVKKNQRRNQAMERLNIALARMAAKEDLAPIVIPKKTRDKDMREILLIEGVVNMLEELLGENAPILENHPLVQKQAQRGITEAQVDFSQAPQELISPKIDKASGTPVRKRQVAKPRKAK